MIRRPTGDNSLTDLHRDFGGIIQKSLRICRQISAVQHFFDFAERRVKSGFGPELAPKSGPPRIARCSWKSFRFVLGLCVKKSLPSERVNKALCQHVRKLELTAWATTTKSAALSSLSILPQPGFEPSDVSVQILCRWPTKQSDKAFVLGMQ